VARSALVALCLSLLLLAGCSVGEDDSKPPQLGVKSGDDEAANKLGFPSSATRNTIRIGGADAASDAAGVAGALFPATGASDRPTAVVLVESDDWQSAIAAAVLAGRPIGAPLLISNGGELPKVTEETLDRLDPKGSDLSKDAQVIRIGDDVARPDAFKTAVIQGDDAYERAAAVDRFFSAARGEPSRDVLLYSGEQAEWAMPAAAWAARSGTATLPVERDAVPAPIRKALAEHDKPNVYLLGPEQAISEKVERQLRPLARNVQRIAGKTPVENAIEFARYRRGDFGWGITIPGYNFTIANLERPLDAAASAGLGTNGVFAPLLLTDDAADLPQALEQYLLSVQPGYEDDPGQAVYNRVWLLGDDTAISVRQQGRVDQITELVPVQANAP
jgi:putative cell wall-binding protein